MTPLVDLGFLLVIFFMLITQFTLPDFVKVVIPASTADTKLNDTDIATILVSSEGAVYFMMEGKRNMRPLGMLANADWGLGLTGQEIEKFSSLPGIGIPVSWLKQFLQLSESEQKKMAMPGIPLENHNNELYGWISFVMASNPGSRIVIKGDRLAPYPVIKKIMDTLKHLGISSFSLVTDTEKSPEN